MARTAVNSAVLGAGGLPPVSRTTAPITTTRQASQPRMKARPFLVPLSELRISRNAMSGKGSRVMPRPIRSRSSTTWPSSHHRHHPCTDLAGPTGHLPHPPGVSSAPQPGPPRRAGTPRPARSWSRRRRGSPGAARVALRGPDRGNPPVPHLRQARRGYADRHPARDQPEFAGPAAAGPCAADGHSPIGQGLPRYACMGACTVSESRGGTPGGQMTRRIPRHTLEGVTGADVSVHPFASDDGLGLALTRFRRAECVRRSSCSCTG